MRNISDAYRIEASSESVEPNTVFKIINDNLTIYIKLKDVLIVDPGSVQIAGKINNASYASQSIKPEKAMSSIGGARVDFEDYDNVFATALNTIYNAGDSIFYNKVEIYAGFVGMDFSDYVKTAITFVKTFTSDELNYTISFADTQKIAEKTLFTRELETELVGNYGYEDTSTVEVISTTGAVMVQHGSDWSEDAGLRVGYVVVEGITKDNRESMEVISYTGFTATQLTGVQRARFGSDRVNLSATQDDNPVSVELKEFVYIDLPQPMMAQALLTGEYGIVGETLPNHWHAGLDASVINSQTFSGADGDLFTIRLDFRGLKEEEAKDFILEQVCAPFGTFLLVDQNGQLNLDRFGYVNKNSTASFSVNYENLIDGGLSRVNRDATRIKNFFNIRWGHKFNGDYFSRNAVYVDGESQERNNFKSEYEQIDLLGIRNTNKNIRTSLDFVADAMLRRYSNPQVTRTIKTSLEALIQAEVGDLVSVEASYETDYRTLEPYFETFEIQSISFDFLSHTATAKLFASEGPESSLIASYGDNVLSIDTTGYTDLADEAYGTVSGSDFTFTAGADLPAGKYKYDGKIIFPPGVVTANGTVYFDSDSVDLQANSKFDMKGRGPLSLGYIGKRAVSQSGMRTSGDVNRTTIYTMQNDLNIINYNGNDSVSISSIIRIENNQDISNVIPENLHGTYGPAGGDSQHPTDVVIPGGNAANGGGGVLFTCNSFSYASSAVIDVSGNDANIGNSTIALVGNGDTTFQRVFYSGQSGIGYAGCCIVALKEVNAIKPFLEDIVIAKNGNFNKFNAEYISTKSGISYRDPVEPPNIPFAARFDSILTSESGRDLATVDNKSAIKVVNLVTAGDYKEDVALDDISSAPTPVFTYNRYMNTPATAQADQVTYELTATANSSISYVEFEYRLYPDGEWNPCEYLLTNESKLQLTANGDQIEIRATAYNSAKNPGGQSSQIITLPIVNKNAEESDAAESGADERITLPPVRGFELINKISNDDFDKFKSPNAEFRWLKSSNTFSSTLSSISGAEDLHLTVYAVTVSDESGNILRQETVKDTSYTYTYDKNKVDNLLYNRGPLRKFKVEVQAISNTGYSSDFAGYFVENPKPSAPSNIQTSAGFTTIEVAFDLPDDFDFVGCDAYIIAGTGDPFAQTPKRYTGNSLVFDERAVGQSYTIGLTSVDQFGAGESSSTFTVSTRVIESSELGDITTPVVIDESGGRLITNNSGFIAFHGATTAAGESPMPLIFGAFSGADYPFWINADGEFKFGLNDNSIRFENNVLKLGDDVTIGSNEDRTYTVGGGGDYATLEDALIAVSKVVPAYKNNGFTAKILLKNGYRDTGTHSFKGVDLGWIEIDSEEATIKIDNTAAAAQWITAENSVLPVFKKGVDVQTNAFFTLFRLIKNSNVEFSPSLSITTTTVGQTTRRCFNADDGSSVHIPTMTFNNFTTAIEGFNSRFQAQNGTINNSSTAINIGNGMYVDFNNGDFVNCSFACVDNNGGAYEGFNNTLSGSPRPNYGIRTDGGSIRSHNSSFTLCSTNGLRADEQANVSVGSTSFRRNLSVTTNADVVVNGGSIVNGNGGNFGTNITINTLTSNGIIFK